MEDVLLLVAIAEDDVPSFEVIEGGGVLLLGVAGIKSELLSMELDPFSDITGVAKIPSNAVAHTTVISAPAFVGITVARAVSS